MAHIFVSYSRRDIDFAGKIVQALAEKDLDTWIDWKSIPKGEYWEQEIYRGIEEADAFLFLLSPDSVRSEMCNKEIAHAVENNKRILPIVIRDADKANFPNETSKKEISKRNWLFCRDGQDNFTRAIDETLKTIHADYEWLKYHTRLQVQALEWERNDLENSFLLRGKELQEAESQLARNSSKEPYPTDLQREYGLRSRQVSDRQRRITTGIAITGIIALAALSIFGFGQAGLARNAEATAISNEFIAKTERANAINEANARATAQAQAEERAKIALARQMVAQAQAIYAAQNSKQMIAVLLATQSMKLFPTSEATQILLSDNFTSHLISRMAHDGPVYSIALSPDGKYLVSGGSDTIVRVWEVATGEEVTRMIHDGRVITVAFSPDGKYVASSSDEDHTARVWEVVTSDEIVRINYEDEVTSIAFSPDGKYVVSGGCDRPNETSVSCAQGTVRVVIISTGQEVTHMIHEDGVTAVAFSLDGKYVVSGSWDNTARVWEAMTGKEIARMTHDPFDFDANDKVYSVAFSPDGKYVVSGSTDNTARVWEASTGKEIARMTHDGWIYDVAFSPDGKYVVSGSFDYAARVWEANSGKEVARIIHDDYVFSVAFSPDGKYVVSGSADFTARVWEAATGQEIARMTHDSSIDTVAFSPDGKFVVSGSRDGTTRVWNSSIGQEAARVALNDYISSAVLSSDGQYVISGGCNKIDKSICTQGTAHVWEALTGKETTVASLAPDSYVNTIAFSPDGKYMALGGCDASPCTQGTVRVWEVSTGKDIALMTHDDFVTSVAFSPDGRYVVSGSADFTARVWELPTGKEVARMNPDSYVFSVAFSQDGKYVVSGNRDGTARVWEASTGKEIARMTHEPSVDIIANDVPVVAFSPDGRYVVSASYDNTVRVWEAFTGKAIVRVTHEDWVTFAIFSQDGKYVVSGSRDGTARVWEASTGKEIARMTHEDSVNSVAFSPDGEYVVSASFDGTARVWEAFTGKEIARKMGGGSTVAFSPDGKYIFSKGLTTAHMWMWQPNDLIANACIYLPRNLTYAEWRQIFPTEEYQIICQNLPIDPKFLIAVAQRALSDTSDPNRLQMSVDKVNDILRETSNHDNLGDEAKKIVGDVITGQISDSDLASGNLKPTLSLLEDAKKIGLEIENVDKLNSVCWFGSLWGFSKDILEYCERAVELAPDDANIRDSRGLARALNGNFSGAIEDFQFFVDYSGNESRIPQRQEWIADLREAKNPFTPAILEQLKAE